MHRAAGQHGVLQGLQGIYSVDFRSVPSACASVQTHGQRLAVASSLSTCAWQHSAAA